MLVQRRTLVRLVQAIEKLDGEANSVSQAKAARKLDRSASHLASLAGIDHFLADELLHSTHHMRHRDINPTFPGNLKQTLPPFRQVSGITWRWFRNVKWR
jgi:hypothetical protein